MPYHRGTGSYGIDVHGQSRKYKTRPGDVPTLNAAMYGFESESEYSRVQAYLKAHGGWQLEAVSIVHFHSLGRQLDRTGRLLLTVVIENGSPRRSPILVTNVSWC